MKKKWVLVLLVLIFLILLVYLLRCGFYYYNKSVYKDKVKTSQLLGVNLDECNAYKIKTYNTHRGGTKILIYITGATDKTIHRDTFKQYHNQLSPSTISFLTTHKIDLETISEIKVGYKEFQISKLYGFLAEEHRPYEIYLFQQQNKNNMLLYANIPHKIHF